MTAGKKVAAAVGAVALAAAAARVVQLAVGRKEMLKALKEVLAIMPELSSIRAIALLPHLLVAMSEAAITTPRRKAAFLAQLAFESGELRYMEEIASGEAYEGRADLGNTQPGDGVRYKGRGPIQLTGRHNYRKAGEALGLPLEEKPWLVSRPEVGFRVAAWFWTSRGLNALADADTVEGFKEITRRINGGFNGLAQREAYWRRARAVFGGAA